VRLAPGEERTVSLDLDVSFEAWNTGGSLSPRVVRRTPATPLPTERETPTDAVRSGGQSPTPGSDTRTGTGTGTATGTGSDTPAQ